MVVPGLEPGLFQDVPTALTTELIGPSSGRLHFFHIVWSIKNNEENSHKFVRSGSACLASIEWEDRKSFLHKSIHWKGKNMATFS